jgi:hypothetical protein
VTWGGRKGRSTTRDLTKKKGMTRATDVYPGEEERGKSVRLEAAGGVSGEADGGESHGGDGEGKRCGVHSCSEERSER